MFLFPCARVHEVLDAHGKRNRVCASPEGFTQHLHLFSLLTAPSPSPFLAEEEPVSGQTGLSGCSLSECGWKGTSRHEGLCSAESALTLHWVLTDSSSATTWRSSAKILGPFPKKEGYQFLTSSEKIPGHLFIPGRSLAAPDKSECN